MSFKKIAVEELTCNPFTMIGKEWMLVTAGNEKSGYNTMTASWGGLGINWNKPVATIYIRPQRYTKKFLDEADSFSLCVFDEDYKKQLGYLGRVSGKDEDKIQKAGITPQFIEDTTYFAEAKLVLICKTLYRAPILPEGFLDKEIDEKNYPQKDYHDLYIAEIIDVLKRD